MLSYFPSNELPASTYAIVDLLGYPKRLEVISHIFKHKERASAKCRSGRLENLQGKHSLVDDAAWWCVC